MATPNTSIQNPGDAGSIRTDSLAQIILPQRRDTLLIIVEQMMSGNRWSLFGQGHRLHYPYGGIAENTGTKGSDL